MKTLIQVSLYRVLTSFKLSGVILIIVPSISQFIYCLTYIFLKASITWNQINQAPFIAVKPMIYLNVSFRDVIENLAWFTLTLALAYRSLKDITFLISELIRASEYSLFLNHDLISSLWFSKFFSELHNPLIRRVWLKATDIFAWYRCTDKEFKCWWWSVGLT